MDLIDREQLMNYIRSRKINIGKLAHDVIMKQPSIQPQEPCEDAISRQAVLDCLTATGLKKYDFILNARDKIKNLPSVRPQEPFNIDTYCKEHFCVMVDKDVWEKAEKALKQEPKTGHWIGIDEEPHEDYECDKCGYVVSTFTANIEPHSEYKYCPNCGARMESEEKHDTDR